MLFKYLPAIVSLLSSIASCQPTKVYLHSPLLSARQATAMTACNGIEAPISAADAHRFANLYCFNYPDFGEGTPGDGTVLINGSTLDPPVAGNMFFLFTRLNQDACAGSCLGDLFQAIEGCESGDNVITEGTFTDTCGQYDYTAIEE